MPYINKDKRAGIDPILRAFLMDIGEMEEGEFVYVVYQMMLWQARHGGITSKLPADWTTASHVVGNVECAKQEFYRHIVGPYEDKKIVENTDINPIDATKHSVRMKD